MEAELRVRVLGPLQVTVAGREIGPGGPLRRSLLALLALRPGEVVPVGALVDGVWGDDPPATATGVLHTYVSTWRKALEAAGPAPRIDTVGVGYRLHLAEGESDLLQFGHLADEGRRLADAGRAADARSALERALALSRGPALADLAGRPFHASAVRPLEERRDRIVEDWAELVLRTGTDDDLVAVGAALRELSAARPWRERAAELLMWSLFRQGRQRDALELFDDTRRRLDEELGIDPGQALRAMHERVLRQDPALGSPETARRARRAPRLDSFVGRDRELGEVGAVLRESRLVTLVGPGGSGKTRLAEEVAADVAAGGVETAVVPLASVEDVALVPGAVSARLELGAAESVEALASQLGDRRLLLVLDNLEQVAGAGPAIAGLLHGTTALGVLATSREPLRVSGEQVYAVDPLPVPAAVALLLDRARSRGAAVPDQDGDALRDVVSALDGLPLALEIVAPWLGVLGPRALLGELDHRLDLTARLTDAGDRHRTLRSAIAWSHDRLTAAEQRLLRRMSVLRGGGDLDAVRAVGGDDLGSPVVDVVVDLVERNLVQRAEPVAGIQRFRLLETVRQFAGERLDEAGEREPTELRVAEHFARWAVGLSAHVDTADADPWRARALADADNLRAAMDALARAGRAGDALQLTVDSWALWFDVGYELEGARRLQAALDAAPPDHPARAIGLAYVVSIGTPDREHDRRRLEEAVALARARRDEPVLAYALTGLGEFATTDDQARDIAMEVAAIAERIRGRPVRYGATNGDTLAGEAADNMSSHHVYRHMPEAIRWQQRAVEAVELGGNPRQIARHLGLLTWLHALHGDADAAEASAARARAHLSGDGAARWEDLVALSSAMVVHLRGDPAAAAAAIGAMVDDALATGRHLFVHYGTHSLVDALVDLGRLEEADAALRRVEELLDGSDDLASVSPVRARRARLLRLAGRPEDAVPLLEETEKGIDPDRLSHWHMVWLVEHALLADDPDEARSFVDRLTELSRCTGVAVPPWERRLLAGVRLSPPAPG
jgi:predicted ATPase/DNA-binding SARP family transcriptional activator